MTKLHNRAVVQDDTACRASRTRQRTLGCRITDGTRRLSQSEGAEQRALRIQIVSGQRDTDETGGAIGMGEVLGAIGRRLVEPSKENVAERACERKIRVPAA
jgi:hypothetical protein